MEERPRRFAIDLIDPLFAVAVNVGIAEGLLAQPWCRRGLFPPDSASWFHLGLFGLGAFNLVMSWIGYHVSIERRPVQGVVRFALDIVLVTLYALTLVVFTNTAAVLCLLAAIYTLYVLWDMAKIAEYPDGFPGRGFFGKFRRELTTLFWCLCFWLLYFGHTLVGNGATLVFLASRSRFSIGSSRTEI